MAVFEFIEGWYNPHRRHSAIDYLSPIDFRKESPLTRIYRKPSAVHSIGVTPLFASFEQRPHYARIAVR